MKQLILTLSLFAFTFMGYSQEKGTTQLSALNVSSSDIALNVSSPSITHYFFNNVGLSLGVVNFDDMTIGTRYYIKGNNFAYAGYGTSSESLDMGLGKTYGWGDHVQIEPRFNLTDITSDDRNLNLSLHLNLVF